MVELVSAVALWDDATGSCSWLLSLGRYCLHTPLYSALKTKTIRYYETIVTKHRATWRHKPEDRNRSSVSFSLL
jgi:hypothetical protein